MGGAASVRPRPIGKTVEMRIRALLLVLLSMAAAIGSGAVLDATGATRHVAGAPGAVLARADLGDVVLPSTSIRGRDDLGADHVHAGEDAVWLTTTAGLTLAVGWWVVRSRGRGGSPAVVAARQLSRAPPWCPSGHC